MLNPEQIVAIANTSYSPKQLAWLDYNKRRTALENAMDSKIVRPTLYTMACSLALFLFVPFVVAISITGTMPLIGFIMWCMGTPILSRIIAHRQTPQLHALTTNIETTVEQQGADFEMTTTMFVENSSQVVEKTMVGEDGIAAAARVKIRNEQALKQLRSWQTGSLKVIEPYRIPVNDTELHTMQAILSGEREELVAGDDQ